MASIGAHRSRSLARGFSTNHAPGRRCLIAFRQHSTWRHDSSRSISRTLVLQFEKYLFSKGVREDGRREDGRRRTGGGTQDGTGLLNRRSDVFDAAYAEAVMEKTGHVGTLTCIPGTPK